VPASAGDQVQVWGAVVDAQFENAMTKT
jgi:hypothetical protein